MSTYRITAAVIIFACSALAAIYLWPHKPATEKSFTQQIITASSIHSSGSGNAQFDAHQTASSNDINDEFSPEVKARLTELLPAQNAWLRARGYANAEGSDGCCAGEDEPFGSLDGTPRDYLQYSNDQLQMLRVQGDMFALHQLAARMSKSDEDKRQNFAKTKALYREAATLGSMYALNALMYIDSMQDISNRKNHPELARQFQLEKEAWDQVLTMRNYQIPDFMKELARDPRAPVLAEADIKQRAEQLYRDLAQQRRDKNLPEFDNSPSELQQTVITEIEKIRAQKKP